ncbi:MAG: SCO4848 family membrane protein [Mycobacteriaceae bacterium]
MKLSRGWSLFLVGFGVWSWIIWPTFLKNIWADPRSFTSAANGGGATGFLVVHALLVTASLVLGTAIAVLGVRGFLAHRRSAAQA